MALHDVAGIMQSTIPSYPFTISRLKHKGCAALLLLPLDISSLITLNDQRGTIQSCRRLQKGKVAASNGAVADCVPLHDLRRHRWMQLLCLSVVLCLPFVSIQYGFSSPKQKPGDSSASKRPKNNKQAPLSVEREKSGQALRSRVTDNYFFKLSGLKACF